MSVPLVSVLIPARNAAATLPACLSSLARQTLDDWQTVIVDDGSEDATARLAQAWARESGRAVVITDGPRGLVGALNAGLAACAGRYVARMDADDLMHRDRLALQVAALERAPHLAGVGSHVRMFPRRGLTPRRREYEAWLNGLASEGDVRRDALVECPIVHPTLMLRAEVARGFAYRDVAWPEDYDLVLRLLGGGHDIGMVARRLVAWRDGPARASRTLPRYAPEQFPACKAHFLAEGFLRDRREYVLWGYGGTGRALRKALLTHGLRPSHVVEIKAGRLGQRIHGAPVVPVDAVPALRGRRIVVSVARAGPRAEVRAAMARMGFEELRDFVCAA